MTKSEAKSAGEALRALLIGDGWKVRVHENMGWHFCVVRELAGYSIKVYQSKSREGRLIHEYSCLLGDAGGLACWSVDSGRRFRDPNQAVLAQYEVALDHCTYEMLNVLALGRLIGKVGG
jgi:hypothetical protein